MNPMHWCTPTPKGLTHFGPARILGAYIIGLSLKHEQFIAALQAMKAKKIARTSHD